MGYMKHHAVCIIGWKKDVMEELHRKALEISEKHEQRIVTDLYSSPVDTYYSFFIHPDGGKEGWLPSDQGDRIRNEIIECIDIDPKFEHVRYVEVTFGEDENHAAKIISSN